MIESLHALHETVHFKADTHLRLYHNNQPEDYPEHWHTPLELILSLENDYSAAIGRHTVTRSDGYFSDLSGSPSFLKGSCSGQPYHFSGRNHDVYCHP